MIRLLFLIPFCFLTMPVLAGEDTLIDDWYVALKAADRASFEAILTPGATIELRSLGIIQAKSEFIEALDYWEDVADDLTLSYTYESVDANNIAAKVCYSFPSNAFINLEIFTINNGRILKQIQEKLRDEC